MKLEKFKEKKNKRKLIVIFTICCIFLLAGVFLYTSFAIFTEDKQFNVINGQYQDPGDLYYAIYVDDQISNTIPSIDSGYTLDTEKSSCNNGVTVSWDGENWSTIVNFTNYQAENMSRTKCTLYFKQQTAYEKCIAEGKDEVTCNIITNVDTNGNCPTVNEDGTVTVNSAESTNGYICSAPDDYGTSYYYRGTVEDNYVYFAGYYWRILRVNGDGSIRIIYDGTSAHANDESSTDRQIGTSAYNSSYNDNAYVGYMHGATGASTYEETHANINDSSIKTIVDEWYRINIEDAGYASYISDTLFCNDRSFNSTNTGTGSGTSTTYYRWNYGPWNSSGTQYPRLTCAEQNDRFTVSDVSTGNGSLTYPVGLLTTDEAVLAGGYSTGNSGYYLYTGNYYWTMSPSYFYFGGSLANVRRVSSTGTVNGNDTVSSSYGVRPVLSLKDGSLKSGSGTALDPYTV